MDNPPVLAGLSEAEPAQALAQYRILQPFAPGRASLVPDVLTTSL
jgi:hypothetical protein